VSLPKANSKAILQSKIAQTPKGAFSMKNVFKVLGVIALVAVIGFGLVSCGGDDDDDGGGKTVYVTGVTLDKTTITLTTTGATEQLTATVVPNNATNKAVTWSSSDTLKATVSTSGLVTAVATGTATITVTTTDGGYQASCTVTVSIPESIPSTGVIPLAKGKWADLKTLNANGVKWFSFVATATPQYIWVWLEKNERVRVELYNASGLLVGDSASFSNYTDDGKSDKTSRTVTVNSTYYIKVTALTAISSSSYAGIGFTDSSTTEPEDEE
jgi:hypothetical protein